MLDPSDTNVFLMVETAEGRRFCGKRHLCDQYLHGGGIAPIGNDVEMVWFYYFYAKLKDTSFG